jgi:hypothetical protein
LTDVISEAYPINDRSWVVRHGILQPGLLLGQKNTAPALFAQLKVARHGYLLIVVANLLLLNASD